MKVFISAYSYTHILYTTYTSEKIATSFSKLFTSITISGHIVLLLASGLVVSQHDTGTEKLLNIS